MSEKNDYEQLIAILDPKKMGDHDWFLSLLDEDCQKNYEDEHMAAVMRMLRIARIRPHKNAIKVAKNEIDRLEREENGSAEAYRTIKNLLAEIEHEKEKMETYRPFFDEPYFARMDLVDNKEGYNSYYIGKKGDIRLEILDWRTPVARRYYQKSCSSFKFNEYEYKTVLRRAIRTKSGKVLDFKNEYLSLKDYLTAEEIADRDEENVLDPYLREIIKSRKEEASVRDIIETIQEKQYEIITRPEKGDFILQGCAGSGKTMVLLHRLSYLMYNNENIKPRDVLIITPSNSFNSFIDELAEILELERVKTTTAYEYFLQVLKNEKIDLADKIDPTQKENEEYLAYVYSPQFVADVRKKQAKVFDSLYGLFTGQECKDFIDTIIEACRIQIQAYEGIKNASMRIRRTVLGEIKERKEGGLYYTKPFRELMNCILDVEDFMNGTLKSERAKSPDYFYRQLMSFYKSAAFSVRNTDRIVAEAHSSLEELRVAIDKEISDLARFKQKIGSVDVYLYADRIARRKEILEEIARVKERVDIIGESNTGFAEFYRYLRGEKTFAELGEGENLVDVIRYFYRETVKKYKLNYGMQSKKMYASDAYALCVVCAGICERLSPVYNYIFVDEGQDISACEYELLRKINPKASFNVFGDVAQNVTPWRGIRDWETAFPTFAIYGLNQNYRNTNQIVEFVSKALHLDMESIGYDGPKVVKLQARGISGFFKDKKGLKALICSEEKKAEFLRKSYNDISVKGKISRSKINIMTVYESKGLEFTSVVVAAEGMTNSERYIAYTRALNELAVIE
ncbi:MAG: UvrD-helicase domain-containing protein [Clostridia bacterium]|nr:UvrD-helicase domain-containing protein [Clostridia bacterium]MBQ8429485.1 UvrD-helicase domain-containing protein [Clostridia bacterium]